MGARRSAAFLPCISLFLAVALSALLFGLSFPPARLRPLAWIALAPLFVALRRVRLGPALFLAGLWGVLAAYAVGDWMPRAISTYFLQPGWVGWAFFLGIAGTTGSLYYVGFAAVYRVLTRGRARSLLPLLAAAAWTATELARGRLFTGTSFFSGNPWGLVGYSQVGWPVGVQIAAWTGVYGIGFAIAAVNAALAELWLARRAGSDGRAALGGSCLAALPALLLILYGYFELRGAPPVEASPGITVAVVQANLDLGSRWRPELYGRNLDTYLDLTRDLIRKKAPRVVFWPEAAMTFFVDREPLYRLALAGVLSPQDAQLVAGGTRWEGEEEDPRYYNSVFLIEPDGDIAAHYDKELLLPFGEFFPLRSIDLMQRAFAGVREVTAGVAPGLLPTAIGPAGIAICNEAMFPEVVAARVRRGATYLANPSNDTWIPEPRFAEQQFDIVSLRAVEQRRFLVRASTSGPSAVVDPWGRVLARTPLGEAAAIVAAVEPRTELSFYGRVGDLFAFGCLACVVATLVIARIRA